MEGRIFSLFLTCVTAMLIFHSNFAKAEVLDENQELSSVIQPEIKRADFDESKIDVNDFEVIVSAGLMSVEDFGTNAVIALKLAYHVSEDFFIDAEYGQSSVGKTSFEILSPGAPLLSEADRDLSYFLVNLGYNFLPGEAFITDKSTYNTALYVLAGLGTTEFAGDSHFTVSYGVGYRFLVSNYMSIYLDVKDITFNIDLIGENKLTHNLETTIGFSYYF